MHFSTKLTIKDTLLVKLILKKSRVVFYLRKIKESEQALNEAEELLQVKITIVFLKRLEIYWLELIKKFTCDLKNKNNLYFLKKEKNSEIEL